MSRLIADLLDYSTVATGARAAKRVDAQALFAMSVLSLQTQIRETGASVKAAPLPAVMADDQLLRVFQNLLDYALKYRSEMPPEVLVSARRSGAEWIFSVRDNGIGFEMRYADQIYGVFQRLHERGANFRGSGIGLAVSKKLVERYGGKLLGPYRSRVWARRFSSACRRRMRVD